MEINKINASEINLVWQNTNPEDSRTDANEQGLSVLDVSRQVQFCLRALICASVPCKKKTAFQCGGRLFDLLLSLCFSKMKK